MTEAPARILVVEDDKTISELVGTILDKDAYKVTLASNGLDALRLAREERPDMVLMDVLMPGLSGFEVCQRLRQDPSTCLIPIMLLTALDQTKDKVTGFKLGADEYMCKPFDSLELLARVERTIRRSREGLAANPLTGLPGGVALEEEIRRRVAEKSPFSVARLDVAGVGEFNIAYGYERGGHVIRLVGMILKSCVLGLADQNGIGVHFGAWGFGVAIAERGFGSAPSSGLSSGAGTAECTISDGTWSGSSRGTSLAGAGIPTCEANSPSAGADSVTFGKLDALINMAAIAAMLATNATANAAHRSELIGTRRPLGSGPSLRATITPPRRSLLGRRMGVPSRSPRTGRSPIPRASRAPDRSPCRFVPRYRPGSRSSATSSGTLPRPSPLGISIRRIGSTDGLRPRLPAQAWPLPFRAGGP